MSVNIFPLEVFDFRVLLSSIVYVTDYDLTINGVFKTQKPKLRKKSF